MAALYHPLRLAEAALLDMLSVPRQLGAGRVSRRRVQRFRRTAGTKRRALSRGRRDRPATGRSRVSPSGAFSFDGIEVLPKPLQQPHPPTWMAATSESAIDWAASRGFSILMDPHSSTRELGDKRRHYAQKLAEAGFSDKGRDIPMARLVALAPTTAAAETVARRGAQWLVDAYAGPQHAHRKTCSDLRRQGSGAALRRQRHPAWNAWSVVEQIGR
jgi:alkanesulfonate monooxygenase SsuD/methylene tetrahydromethanopterin reductase-like flavin-dependent oxidoreductase (luciferase family)